MTLPRIPYNWKDKKYKLWDQNPPGTDFASPSYVGALDYLYGQWTNSQLAPYSQNWNAGYDAVASEGHYTIGSNDQGSNRNRSGLANIRDKWNALLGHANANFCNHTYYVPLFVNAISIDLGISGATAQSNKTRDFYPHNITIPSFTIQGQCYSTAHYGSLIEYIHMAQHASIKSIGSRDNLIQFYLSGDERKDVIGRTQTGANVTSNASGRTRTAYNQKIVGVHPETICLGYVNSIDRTHQAGNHRPTWQAEFIVVQMLRSPLFEEQRASEKETHIWLRMLKSTNSTDWMTPHNQKVAESTLKKATRGTNTAISVLASDT